MPDKPVAHNQNVPLGSNAAAGGASPVDDGSGNPIPVPGDDPDVGLSQKGTGEDAVIRRETEI